jgi:hypothetical protein
MLHFSNGPFCTLDLANAAEEPIAPEVTNRTVPGPRGGSRSAGVEALDVAVLPGAASLDVSGLGTDNRDPFLHRGGDELRSVVGPDVSGNADAKRNFFIRCRWRNISFASSAKNASRNARRSRQKARPRDQLPAYRPLPTR